MGDQALDRATAHLVHNRVGGGAFVEAVGTLGGNALQGDGEIGLAEALAGLRPPGPGGEVGSLGETGARAVQDADELGSDHEAVTGQGDGRRQVLLPGQLAEAPVRLRHAAHRARDSDSQVAHQAEAGIRFARGGEVHARARRGRRRLAVVQEVRLAAHIERHEAATAEVAGLGIGDGQGEGGGHRRVDGVAALLEDLLGRQGAVDVGRGDGAGAERAGSGGAGGRMRGCEGRTGDGHDQRRQDGQQSPSIRHRAPPQEYLLTMLKQSRRGTERPLVSYRSQIERKSPSPVSNWAGLCLSMWPMRPR